MLSAARHLCSESAASSDIEAKDSSWSDEEDGETETKERWRRMQTFKTKSAGEGKGHRWMSSADPDNSCAASRGRAEVAAEETQGRSPSTAGGESPAHDRLTLACLAVLAVLGAFCDVLDCVGSVDCVLSCCGQDDEMFDEASLSSAHDEARRQTMMGKSGHIQALLQRTLSALIPWHAQP